MYLLIQMMYLSKSPEDLHEDYFKSVRELQNAVPSMSVVFMNINDHIMSDNYYKALKEAKRLLSYEEELLNHATA